MHQREALEKRLREIKYEDFESLIRLGLWALEMAIPNLDLLVREIEYEQSPKQSHISRELRRILKSAPSKG